MRYAARCLARRTISLPIVSRAVAARRPLVIGRSRGDPVSTNRSPKTNPSLRRRVFERDRGICALCGVDSAVLGAVLAREWRRVKLAHTPRQREERAGFRRRYRWYFRRTSYWDADHIIPVVEGGECTLENMRTLCVPCHQQVTKDLARRRASRRRQERRGQQGRGSLMIEQSLKP